jgi:ElaB/YqjD/DUF883 family membrane-anchored ribosome-binding protein
MGQKPDELENEIQELRQESDVIIDELLKRGNLASVASNASHAAGTAVRGAVSTVSSTADTVSHKTETLVHDTIETIPEPIRSRPYIAAGIASGLLSTLGAYAATMAILSRRKTPEERAAERVRATADRAGSELEHFSSRLADAVDSWRHRAEEARHTRVETRREQPGMLKRVLWVAIASGMATLGSMLFKRLTSEGWRKTMHADPQES